MNRKGQILPLALVMLVAMAMGWVMLLNLGKLIKERVRMQIIADTTVQSAAAFRARGLNTIGLINSWLGVPVAGIGSPEMAWWPAIIHPYDPANAAKSGAGVIQDTVKAAKQLLKTGVHRDTLGQVVA